MLSPNAAFDVFIGGSLLILAAALVLAGRRKSDSWLLLVFLVLVATNFLASAMQKSTLDLRWIQLGHVALALDPLFLLLFVTAHPYVRRPPGVLLGLGVLGLVATLGVLVAVARPSALVEHWSVERLLIVSELAVAYVAAWLLAVRGAVEAPTPLLQRRAAWLAAAVGVATVPRIVLLPADYYIREMTSDTVHQILLEHALGLLVMLALLAVAFRLAHPARSALRRPLQFVVVIAVAFVAFRVAVEILEFATPYSVFRLAVPYGVRWLIFGFILMGGVLTYEVLEFRKGAERVLASLTGAMGALAGVLAGILFAEGRGADPALVTTSALGAGLALGWIAALAARLVLQKVHLYEAAAVGTKRRLELYRASLESAWASGPPDPEARRVLERDRRSFGVSVEEGRALEHVVASAVAGSAAGLRLGDEAAVGVMLEEVLGEGAHGKVFLARRYPSGERVVVKEMRDEAGGSQQTRRRLLQEARALQRLDHPNLVRLLDVQAEAGRYLLVMEHVEGVTLSRRLRDGPMSSAAACRLANDLLDALEAVHREGVVHRDIKPSNILLAKDGRARLTDFGVAALGASQAARATATSIGGLGDFAGTLAYAAPEQLQGEARPATDLYAVGLVVYEALTGRPALRLEGMRMIQALDHVARPSVDFAAVPSAWRTFVARAIDPRPEGRFPSAAAMRRALLDVGSCREALRDTEAVKAGRRGRSAPP